MYEPQNGIISVIIRFFRPDFNYVWLAAGDSSLIWIFLTICWQYICFHTVIFMAGLSSIPDELYEAARLDGASEWQLCWKIIIPCMKPTILLSATLSVIGSLKYFDLVYLMGQVCLKLHGSFWRHTFIGLLLMRARADMVMVLLLQFFC